MNPSMRTRTGSRAGGCAAIPRWSCPSLHPSSVWSARNAVHLLDRPPLRTGSEHTASGWSCEVVARPGQDLDVDPRTSAGSHSAHHLRGRRRGCERCDASRGEPPAASESGRYSARVADPSPSSTLRAILPWAAASAIVLALAVTAGLFVAYLVASGRAVDAPDSAAASPTPRRTPVVSVRPSTPGPSGEATVQPRRTPTPLPVITPEPSPFEHVVSRGESLSYIAGLYCTTVEAISELNGIANPNRIRIGTVLQIPGGGCASPEPNPG